ncbi:hypothetical protein [Paraliomyxa miuraensis]|uniref:hypothetical protein n=1 Tax=Paraliomyxa miuraensis TaxID=376150 RepID=UPI0022568B90|nr:hypothetical protein [Paraliomyxa miuraensis]MCX4240865.1 hypothetical protein [Paraliomyxa miuraensis]
MKTELTTCALLLIAATLGTACDIESTPMSTDSVFRDGEDIDPPTDTSGGIVLVKGGDDLIPIDVREIGYASAAPQWQQVFFDGVVLPQVREGIEVAFLSDGNNWTTCPKICEDLEATWNGGVYIEEGFDVSFGEVITVVDVDGVNWQTEATYKAEVGCGCES